MWMYECGRVWSFLLSLLCALSAFLYGTLRPVFSILTTDVAIVVVLVFVRRLVRFACAQINYKLFR